MQARQRQEAYKLQQNAFWFEMQAKVEDRRIDLSQGEREKVQHTVIRY